MLIDNDFVLSQNYDYAMSEFFIMRVNLKGVFLWGQIVAKYMTGTSIPADVGYLIYKE